MATITSNHGVWSGASDDGRIAYTDHAAGSVQIDGRWAWRGKWVGDDGRATADDVPQSDWAAAVAVILAVQSAREARQDAVREAVYARQDAREEALDGIERVRGGAYDHNTF